MTVVVVPRVPGSVPWARHNLARELTERGLPAAVIDDACLVLSELVGNAVRHGGELPAGGVQITWCASESSVEVSVGDGGGSAGPELAPPDASATGGRGLAIVDAVASRWGVSRTATTCVVWARVAQAGTVQAAGHPADHPVPG